MYDKLDQVGKLYHNVKDFNWQSYLNGPRYETIREFIRGPNILEVGCGRGEFSRRLSEEKIFSIISIDGSLINIEGTKKKCNLDYITFEHCLFEEFQTNKRFDDIIIANSLEHVDDPVKVLLHMKKFLKKEGRIHITVPNAMSIHRQLGTEMGILEFPWELNESDKKVEHQRVYTKELLEEDIRRAGLRVIRQDGIMLKFLSNKQMCELTNSCGEKFLEGLYELGRKYSDIASELYFLCML